MSRIVPSDFKKLVSFIDEYNLKGVVKDSEYLDALKPLHKHTFALSTITNEILFQDGGGSGDLNSNQKKYLKELSSDVSIALFEIISGGYKPARMMLRSSIETYFKFSFSAEYPGIVAEKSLFNIFDTIKEIPFIKEDLMNQSAFQEIRGNYSYLCEYVHTANHKNMMNITALNYYPSFSKEKIDAVGTVFLSLMKNIIYLISKKYNKNFHAMHHENKAIVISCIKKSYRPKILINL